MSKLVIENVENGFIVEKWINFVHETYVFKQLEELLDFVRKEYDYLKTYESDSSEGD